MRNPWTGEEEGGSTSGGQNKMEEPWAALSERSLVAMLEQLFSHLLKVLNICAHVLDDTPPGPAVKVSLIGGSYFIGFYLFICKSHFINHK